MWYFGKCFFLGFGFLVFSLNGCISQKPAFKASDVFLVDVSIIDTVDGTVTADQTIVVRDDRIHAIGRTNRIRPLPGAEVIEVSGYVVPGFWDMHVHLLSDADDLASRIVPLLVSSGIVGVRDMGSELSALKAARDRLAQEPSSHLPEIIASGPLLDGVKYPWPGYPQLLIDSAETARRELPGVLDAGADFFKVYGDLNEESYRAILEYAAEREVQVAGHLPTGVSLSDAAKAGQASIEHGSVFSLRGCIPEVDQYSQRAIAAKFGRGGWSGFLEVAIEATEAVHWPACAQEFATLAAEGTFFTPTLMMEFNERSRIEESALEYLSPNSRSWCEQSLDAVDTADPETVEDYLAFYSELMAVVRKSDTRVLAGTDTQNFCLVPGVSLHWEMARLVETGGSPLEALQAATLNPAAYLGRSLDAGQVKTGFEANFIILASNPLKDISATQKIEVLIMNGEVFHKEDLLRLRKQAARVAQDKPE